MQTQRTYSTSKRSVCQIQSTVSQHFKAFKYVSAFSWKRHLLAKDIRAVLKRVLFQPLQSAAAGQNLMH